MKIYNPLRRKLGKHKRYKENTEFSCFFLSYAIMITKFLFLILEDEDPGQRFDRNKFERLDHVKNHEKGKSLYELKTNEKSFFK